MRSYPIQLVLLFTLVFLSLMQSMGQIKVPPTNSFTNIFQFPPVINDSPHMKVTLARMPAGEAANNITGKTSAPLATCNTSTFYMHLSLPAGQKMNLKALQTLPNGNFILAGNTTAANSIQDGFIAIMTNAGNMVSQRQIRINNAAVTLFSTRVLVNGKFVIAGIFNDGSNKAFVALLHADLSTDWVNIFDLSAAPIKTTLGLSDNNLLTFAVQLPGAVMVSLVNLDGSAGWSREIAPQGLDELVGFSESTYGGYVLLTNCTRLGKKVVDFLRMNGDGSDKLSQVIGNGIDEYKYDDVKLFNGRAIAVGVVKKGAAQFQLTRDIIQPSASIETSHNYTIPLTVDFNTTSAFDNAGDAMGFCFPQQGKMVFIRHFAYYQTPPEYTREYDVPVGSGIAAVARSLSDGGYLFGLNTKNAGEIILIKTDSIGILAGCSYKTISNKYTETLGMQNTMAATKSNATTLPLSRGSLTDKAITINNKFDCKQDYCPAPPVEDSCLSTYFKTLRSASNTNAFGSYHLMRNNNIIVSFSKYDRVTGTGNVATYGIKLLDEKGHFIKGVNVFCDGVSNSFELKKINEQHVMAIFYTVKNGQPIYTFTLINDDLQILWSRSFETFKDYNFRGTSLTTDAEGNYYFVGNTLGFMSNASVMAFKMDPNGNPLWLKIYDLEQQLLFQSCATTTNTSLIIVIEGPSMGSVSVSIDKVSGQMITAYAGKNKSQGYGYERFLQFDKDRVFYVGNDVDGNFIMTVYDTTGKPLQSKYINKINSVPRATILHEGSLYSMYEFYNGTETKMALIKVDRTLSLQFCNAYDFFGYPQGMGVSDNGNIYVGGNYIHGGVNGNYYDAYIQKYDNNGALGTCAYEAISPGLIDADVSVNNVAFYPVTKTFTPVNIGVDFLPLINDQNIGAILCSSLPQCTSVKLAGPKTVCSLQDPFTFKATLPAGCTLKPVWLYDTAFAVLKSTTNSSVDFTFKKPGKTWIKASINAGCSVIMDSILVEVQNLPISFTLGKDRAICAGDSIRLNAGAGFNSYLWQNGSADSIFIAKAPGVYHVRVDNLCGNTYADTIVVSAVLVPKLNIGKDTAVCAGTTLQIAASPGFNSYQWKTATAGQFTGATISIVAIKNEQISVIATTAEGCLAYDSLNITVVNTRAVFLGNDTSFCAPGSITLSAGQGYSQYTWSNGSTQPAIVVSQAGSYWVTVKDVNNCVAKDTLTIKEVFALPKITLGNDFDVCIGAEKKLDAGNFNKYIWNDGSLERYKTVKLPGAYWVRVTDQNNCSTADTVLLKQLLPAPGNFLKAVDSLCSYEKLTISPTKNYSDYLWSTGSYQSILPVQKAGQYILTVTDANGCVGKDSIRIIEKKNCATGIFFPTAFTPNGDYLNDVFNATVFGNIISFQLQIYNRWGELVFRTNSVQNGWDGKIKGQPSNAGVFVWTCTYQLQGGETTFQKGVVTLYR